jgi:hypothetical protein
MIKANASHRKTVRNRPAKKMRNGRPIALHRPGAKVRIARIILIKECAKRLVNPEEDAFVKMVSIEMTTRNAFD